LHGPAGLSGAIGQQRRLRARGGKAARHREGFAAALPVHPRDVRGAGAHFLGLGAFAMDLGAVTVFLLTFTDREKIYNLAEAISGARFTTSYTRIGGVMRDLPPGWLDQCKKFCAEFIPALNEVETLLTRNRIWVDRVRNLAVISREDAIDYGL